MVYETVVFISGHLLAFTAQNATPGRFASSYCRLYIIPMSDIDYRFLLFEISEKIDWLTERKRLLYIFKTYLPGDSETDIQDLISLLTHLEDRNLLGIDRLEALKDLLKGTRKWDLHEIVETFEEKRRAYKRLLLQFSRTLDECNELQQLISICRGKIPHDREGEIKNVFTLLTELEKQNNLGFGRLGILGTMAVKMKKPDLLKQLKVFEEEKKSREFSEKANYRSQQFWKERESEDANSMTTETSDSGQWSQSASSESGFNKEREDIQEKLERVDEWMKNVTDKLDNLTGPRVANKDEDNIQQIQKELRNIRKTLDTLKVSDGKIKSEGSGLTKRIWRAMTKKKNEMDTSKTPNDKKDEGAVVDIERIPEDYRASDMERLRDHDGQVMIFYVQRDLDQIETITRKTWRSVGRALQVDARDLDLIKSDCIVEGSPTESLLKKMQTFANEPTMREFVQALNMCGRNDVANFICNWPWEINEDE